MKKLFLIAIMATMFASCTSNKVQIFNNRANIETDIESMDGTMYDVAIYFFDDSDRLIKSVTLGNIKPLAHSPKFDAADNAKYFKAEWSFLHSESEFADVAGRIRSGEYTQIVKGLSVLEISERSKIVKAD